MVTLRLKVGFQNRLQNLHEGVQRAEEVSAGGEGHRALLVLFQIVT